MRFCKKECTILSKYILWSLIFSRTRWKLILYKSINILGALVNSCHFQIKRNVARILNGNDWLDSLLNEILDTKSGFLSAIAQKRRRRKINTLFLSWEFRFYTFATQTNIKSRNHSVRLLSRKRSINQSVDHHFYFRILVIDWSIKRFSFLISCTSV